MLGKTQRTVQGSNYGLSNGTDIAKAKHKKQAKQQEEEGGEEEEGGTFHNIKLQVYV